MGGVSALRDTGQRVPTAAFAVVSAGIAAALHVGKMPPAIPSLQATLGIGLVDAGFLLSLVQLAGMTFGLVVGLAADSIGLRRSLLIGMSVIAVASAAGGWVGASAPAGLAVPLLLVLRGIEGFGFLLVAMPAPGLIRALSPAQAERKALGIWGAYMPFGIALALLIGPGWIAAVGWPGWWWLLSAVTAAVGVWVALVVPKDLHRAQSHEVRPLPWSRRLIETVSAGGPWMIALAFAVYSSQWMAVIGFLPAIYSKAGVPDGWNAVLTAIAASLNIVGNVMGGRLLQRGMAPDRLLRLGFITMACTSVLAFVQLGDALQLPPQLRYLAICVFSLGGGVVPATLFMLSVRLAPTPSTVSTTVGLMQQASSLGQFLSPPLVAWIAHRMGGWQWTWLVTLSCSLMGLMVAARLPSVDRRSTA
ncbi:MAG: MFS transporter [Gammaproteobacteria bacterium]|nr:MFS transporter [Gammaproteobacteria bacterium]MBU1440602.1 MFS transporter [Gammaproteobacteria bacterium]MBU2287622.1 MFS transporter [Gammaproteobacteria bacterium]MBU2410626.1 MFS transporter [Gammaproteobacteria bacterium]